MNGMAELVWLRLKQNRHSRSRNAKMDGSFQAPSLPLKVENHRTLNKKSVFEQVL
jgi:hypothetical protein